MKSQLNVSRVLAAAASAAAVVGITGAIAAAVIAPAPVDEPAHVTGLAFRSAEHGAIDAPRCLWVGPGSYDYACY